jgi:endonuclease/exonuclease/phosphatase family metal-dependent hydrolase
MELGFTHVYRSKYGLESFAQRIPLLREQGNAFITNQNINARGFHYFREGVKRLVIELEFERFTIFLVHLSLRYQRRQGQLRALARLFRAARKPTIVAGDFNALWGEEELDRFRRATGLLSANAAGAPTFPAYAPRRQLDFILHDPSIRITHFEVPQVHYSDHLPLLCDFEVNGDRGKDGARAR